MGRVATARAEPAGCVRAMGLAEEAGLAGVAAEAGQIALILVGVPEARQWARCGR